LRLPHGKKAVSPLISTIILIALCVAGGLVVYSQIFSTSNILSARGQVTVESVDLAVQTDGQTVFTITIKNTGNKPVSELTVNLAGTDYTVTLPSGGLQPGRSACHVETNPTPPANGFVVGKSYNVVVKATFSDGSGFSKTETVKCMGSGVSIEQGEYTVTFSQSGLPDGTRWTVTFGGRTKSSTDSSITFRVDEGSYDWSVQPADASGVRYAPSPSSGTMEVPTQTSREITFSVSQYKLSLSIASEGGSVQLNPESSDGYYDPETSVEATAIPGEGYMFDHWKLDGNPVSDNPITVTMNEPHSLEAYFAEAQLHDWLSGWNYRKSHEIVGSTAGAVTDYQVRIKVHFGSGTDSGEHVYLNGKCRTDFGDIRFTASDGSTLLDYWMEKKVDGDYAVFWVEVSNIPASPDTATIYIYHDNPDVTTTSNGEATFQAFLELSSGFYQDLGVVPLTTYRNGKDPGDRFLASSLVDTVYISPCLWFRYYGGKKYSIESTPKLYFGAYLDSGNYGHEGIDIRMRTSAPPTGAWQGSNAYTADTTLNRKHIIVLDYRTISGTPSLSFFSRWFVGDDIPDGTCVAGYGLTSTVRTVSEYVYNGAVSHILVRIGSSSSSSHQINIYRMYYAVAKYVDPEPSHGVWGSEETLP